MEFDEADVDRFLASGIATTVFTQQMGQVIGYGALWDLGPYDVTNDETRTGPNEFATEYTGANGLAAYRAEVDPTATFVPLEETVISGFAGRRWDEIDPADPTTPVPNNFFREELMAAILTVGNEHFISETTLASFADLGYNTRAGYDAMTLDQLIVAASAPTAPAVPLPAGVWLLGSGIVILGAARRRRKQNSA